VLARADLEDAAIRVIDRHGLDGLSMRAVAAELGTGPMTLYNYISDRAELDAFVVDGVLRPIQLPPAPSVDWRADVHEIAGQTWAAVRAHPNGVPLILARRSHSPRFLDIAEQLLEALARSGLSGQDLLAAFRAVSTLATAFALNELGSPLSERGGGREATIERFHSLPADRYGRLVDMAAAAGNSGPAAELHRGLEARLNGLCPPAPGETTRFGGPRHRRG